MSNLDRLFRALADSQRRRALSCLQKHHTVSLADLAEWVAEQESQDEITAISSERVRDIYFALYHNHVPKLAEANLVHYDQEDDMVYRAENATSLLTNVRDRVDSLAKKR